jgi:very-long-chain (3R)-3-hydroxyacyl-CoA dehydratase
MSRVLYLKLYNGVSATLWSLVFYYTLEELEGYANEDPASLYISKRLPEGMLYPHKFMVRLQLANAAIEVAHSLAGIVHSPLSTLILQFAARLVITSGVSYALPHSPGNYTPAYAMLLVAWAVSEIIRYGYYLLKQILDAKGRAIPLVVVWLRYSAFLVLYPAGLLSEPYVVYLSLKSARALGVAYYGFLVFALASYIPGFWILYSYMLRQRSRYVSGRQMRGRQLKTRGNKVT